MTQNIQTDDATDEQLDKELVATTLGQIGDQHNPYDDDAPEMRLWNIARNARHRNVHRGLFIDAENPDGQLRYGWTNDQRSTWKVTDAGDTLKVADVHDLEVPDDETPVEDEQHYVQEWMDIVLYELRSDAGGDSTSRSVRDQIEFVGQRTLRVDDEHGHKATFDIELTEDN